MRRDRRVARRAASSRRVLRSTVLAVPSRASRPTRARARPELHRAWARLARAADSARSRGTAWAPHALCGQARATLRRGVCPRTETQPLPAQSPRRNRAAGGDHRRCHLPSNSGAYTVTLEVVNAVRHFATLLEADAVRRLAALRVVRFDPTSVTAVAPRSLDVDGSRARVIERWESDLCGLLNAM